MIPCLILERDACFRYNNGPCYDKVMQSKVFFRSSTQNDYELTVDHEADQYVPKFLSEDDRGWIQDLSTDKGWESLAEMTQDLRVEITGWGSDIGD